MRGWEWLLLLAILAVPLSVIAAIATSQRRRREHPTDDERAEARGRRMPWAFAIGAPVMLLGLIAMLVRAGGPNVTALVVFGAGLLLVCTGLIQRSIERSR